MSVFTGSGVAIITPFDENDNVNFEEYAKLIEFQIENKTDAIITCGTTGEPSTMTSEEKRNVIDFTVKTVNGRVPVIAGTGSNCTKTVIEDSIFAKNAGADALLIVTPYYNKCTQQGLIEHFNAIADAVDLPIIVYSVASRTGVNILPQTVKELSKHKNIVAIKEASGDINQIAKIAALCPDLDIYSGNDDHIVPVLSLGGKGVISVAANVIPNQIHDIVAKFKEGNFKDSLDIQLKYLDLISLLFCEVNPIPVKAAATLMGFDFDNVRLPLTKLSSNNLAKLSEEMKKLNLV